MSRVLPVAALAVLGCAPPEHSFAWRADSAARAYAADSAAMVARAEEAAVNQRAADTVAATTPVPIPTADSSGLHRFTAEDSLPTVVEDAAATAPRFEKSGTRSVLHLPPEMMAALRTSAPGFRTFRRADYSASFPDSNYGDPSKQTDFAVIGDFDGNGRLDVALYGRDTSVVLIAVVDGARGLNVFEMARDTDERGPTIEGHLTYGAPGTLRDPDDQPFSIDHDYVALQQEMSTAIYYYRNGMFESLIFGD